MAVEFPVCVKNLSAFYGKTQVLNNISFAIEKGTVLCIAGPNGSGKSTLLSLIAGLKIPALLSNYKDSIEIFKRNIALYKRKELSRLVSFAPQNCTPVWNNTVFDMVLQGRYSHTNWTQTYTEEDLNAAEKSILNLNLEKEKNRNVFSLSGGEYQRVVLARSLAGNPRLLLLDEPVSNLDVRYQYLLLETVCKAAKTENITVVVSLHDLNLAARFADRIILLSSGKIKADGNPCSVFVPEILDDVYGLKFSILVHPELGCPQIFVK